MARYNSIAADRAARACSPRPIWQYSRPRPRWQWAASGCRVPRPGPGPAGMGFGRLTPGIALHGDLAEEPIGVRLIAASGGYGEIEEVAGEDARILHTAHAQSLAQCDEHVGIGKIGSRWPCAPAFDPGVVGPPPTPGQGMLPPGGSEQWDAAGYWRSGRAPGRVRAPGWPSGCLWRRRSILHKPQCQSSTVGVFDLFGQPYRIFSHAAPRSDLPARQDRRRHSNGRSRRGGKSGQNAHSAGCR